LATTVVNDEDCDGDCCCAGVAPRGAPNTLAPSGWNCGSRNRRYRELVLATAAEEGQAAGNATN
jgi:hypothetical protein